MTSYSQVYSIDVGLKQILMVDSNSKLVTVMETMHSETDLHSQFVNIFFINPVFVLLEV